MASNAQFSIIFCLAHKTCRHEIIVGVIMAAHVGKYKVSQKIRPFPEVRIYKRKQEIKKKRKKEETRTGPRK